MPDAALESRIRALVADMVLLEPHELDVDASMETLDSWDSLAHINLMAALEEEFRIEFDVREFEEMVTLPLVIQCVVSKL